MDISAPPRASAAPLLYVRARQIPAIIQKVFGDIVSLSTISRLRRRYPLAVPCREADLRQWWIDARNGERLRQQARNAVTVPLPETTTFAVFERGA